MNQDKPSEQLEVTRDLFRVATDLLYRAESANSEASMRSNQEAAKNMFPQVAASAAAAQAEALAAIASALERIARVLEAQEFQQAFTGMAAQREFYG